MEIEKTENGFYADLREADFIHTYGGEYKDDDIDISYYGIQIDDLSIEITPKIAILLCRSLKEHLELNGNKI